MKFITIIISGIKYLVFENGSKVKIPESSIVGEFLFENAEKIVKILQTPTEISTALKNGRDLDVIMQYGRINFTNGVPDMVRDSVGTEDFFKNPGDSSLYEDICK